MEEDSIETKKTTDICDIETELSEHEIVELSETESTTKVRTITDVYSQLGNTIKSISKYTEHMDISNTKSLKQTYNFLSWTTIKIDMILKENDIKIPKNIIPSTINSYVYKKLKLDIQKLIEKLYVKIKISDADFMYKLDVNKEILESEVKSLAEALVLKRGSVIWVEFGFNIGHEFGGKHPALILKNISDGFVVAPLSSKKPKEIKDYHVKVNRVDNFTVKKSRWINIHRIVPISMARVDFDSTIGKVRGEILDSISTAIKKCGIK
ncbi:type II toxin-antitoxin system PemK/MazF family toxin [Clostridium sp. C8-1-8]|uniref:type II toxin-antitoxin system PemK/MazF family toxin n=1 Tax=Clostridium sp. C8-1-8 TaxID=2698831 RepID=UPI00136B9A5D|nr:type II toxin-antitoxin system PemK/MazF family toxin [Clostridium sp. C8-1-8]